MRSSFFYFLFGVFFIGYTLINTYIFVHGYRMLGVFGISSAVFITFFLFLSGSFIVGEIWQRRKSSSVSDTLITIGSLWFVCIVHFGSVCILYDLLLLLNISFYLFSPSLLDLIAYSTTWITVVVTFCMIVIGYLNCLFPTVRRYDIVLHKKNPLHSELTFAVATDIHLGPINGAPHIQRIVRKIHALNPDIILLPGDILDGDLSPVIRRDLGSHLKQLQARYGVWGVTGNHEYIGGIDRAVKYLTDHGVRVLRDASVVVEGVALIGRDDRAGNHIGSHERADLASILPTNYSDLPTVLMDHQPKNLADARELGVDVQFSGHTHNGQLFPLNYIVDMIFELGYGYKKKNNTHTFVSSGVGTWGPPVRTNSRPEILFVTVRFDG